MKNEQWILDFHDTKLRPPWDKPDKLNGGFNAESLTRLLRAHVIRP
ncbi:MAG: hypothetical protein ACYDBH_11535 [Acidobacteriaceae bacterium]